LPTRDGVARVATPHTDSVMQRCKRNPGSKIGMCGPRQHSPNLGSRGCDELPEYFLAPIFVFDQFNSICGVAYRINGFEHGIGNCHKIGIVGN
jgi:hypothetical protein